MTRLRKELSLGSPSSLLWSSEPSRHGGGRWFGCSVSSVGLILHGRQLLAKSANISNIRSLLDVYILGPHPTNYTTRGRSLNVCVVPRLLTWECVWEHSHGLFDSQGRMSLEGCRFYPPTCQACSDDGRVIGEISCETSCATWQV